MLSFFLLKKYVLSQKKGLSPVVTIAILQGKHLWQSLFLNKVAGLIEKDTLAQVISCEFCQISKNTFSCRTPPMDASDTGIFENCFLFYGQS